jgi:hypothetical protein
VRLWPWSTLTPTKIEGSAGPTLNRKLRIKRVNPAAAEMPITAPSSEIFPPRDRISMTTALHRLEIPLDAIYAHRKSVDQVEALGVLGQDGSKHARNDVSKRRILSPQPGSKFNATVFGDCRRYLISPCCYKGVSKSESANFSTQALDRRDSTMTLNDFRQSLTATEPPEHACQTVVDTRQQSYRYSYRGDDSTYPVTHRCEAEIVDPLNASIRF